MPDAPRSRAIVVRVPSSHEDTTVRWCVTVGDAPLPCTIALSGLQVYFDNHSLISGHAAGCCADDCVGQVKRWVSAPAIRTATYAVCRVERLLSCCQLLTALPRDLLVHRPLCARLLANRTICRACAYVSRPSRAQILASYCLIRVRFVLRLVFAVSSNSSHALGSRRVSAYARIPSQI